LEHDLVEVQKRVKRYWFKDGIGEIVIGGLFLLLAVYFAGHRWLPADSSAPMFLDGGLALILVLGVFFTRKLIHTFKLHITYPRTGYVEYYPAKNETFAARVFIFFSIAGFAILLIVFGKWVGSFQWLTGFLGVVGSIILLVIRTYAVDLKRFYYLAGASFVLGLVCSFSGLSPHYSLSLFYALFSLVLIAIGSVTLTRYLRENPLPVGGIDD
jgi:hypothetical protein